MRKSMVEMLMEVRFPAIVLTASVDWGCSMNLSRARLTKAVVDGYVMKYGKHYLPLPKLIDKYLEV
mgnify:CR=1 FL=1